MSHPPSKRPHPLPGEPRLYGRTRSHPLRREPKRRMDTLFPKVALDELGLPLDPQELFDIPARELWLEIGFGGGEHLVWQAAHNRDIGFIGVEPFLNGVSACLGGVEAEALENVRLCMGDARLLMGRLPAACLSRVFILHPDPWPKFRHAKRRLIQRKFLTDLARLMQPGAQLRLGTDWAAYSTWALQHLLAHPDFEWTAQRAADWQERPDDWPITRYARKAAAEGRRDVHLEFIRR